MPFKTAVEIVKLMLAQPISIEITIPLDAMTRKGTQIMKSLILMSKAPKRALLDRDGIFWRTRLY